MTTDTDALEERLAEALDPCSEIVAVHEGYGAEVVVHDHQSSVIAAVLPAVAEEVRKAKAEALREAAEWAERGLGWVSGGRTNTDSVRYWLRERAAEYETGDQR